MTSGLPTLCFQFYQISTLIYLFFELITPGNRKKTITRILDVVAIAVVIVVVLDVVVVVVVLDVGVVVVVVVAVDNDDDDADFF